jgi:hypothetical protein
MKFLAIEREIPGVSDDASKPFLEDEALKAWELYQQGFIRELYFRRDRSEAVLVLECRDRGEAERILGTLPLVQRGLIRFELIELIPYPGFARLFNKL